MSDCGFRMADGGLETLSLRLRVHSQVAICSLLLLTLQLSGCGSSDGAVSVGGSVTYQGQPLTNASLTFFPQKGRAITAPLDANGTYSARLPAGPYRVAVTVGAVIPEGYREGDPLPPPALVLPAKYTHRTRTELTAEISESQSEPLNFELK